MTAADGLPESGLLSYLYQRSAEHAHRGIDLPAPKGTPVYAAASGTVAHATDAWQQGFTGYGRVVVVDADDGTHHLYAHLQGSTVRPGARIAAGQLIGYVGNSIFSRDDKSRESGGAHLHFEVSPTPYPQLSSEADRLHPVEYLRAGRVHPLRAEVLGGPITVTESKGTRAAALPFSGSFSRCPCCGQPLPTTDGGTHDNSG